MLVDLLGGQTQTAVQECPSGMQHTSSCNQNALEHAQLHNVVVMSMTSGAAATLRTVVHDELSNLKKMQQ